MLPDGLPFGLSKKAKADYRDRLLAYMAEHDADPHQFMAACIAGLIPGASLDHKIACARELAQYVIPKLKAIELSGDAANPIRVLQELSDSDLARMISGLLQAGQTPRQEGAA